MQKKSEIKKAIEEVLRGAPKIKGVKVKDIEKYIHDDGICPATGNPYREVVGPIENTGGYLSGGIGRGVTCSECGQLIYRTGIRF